eukprot:TRINITY_DN2001_c0_g1_i2.p1 TRINITY_DN2001_c0_g1~~TRINITY_DN2001_c0_g1_i2.p1  ORF type:complete len:101 (-),score=8.55 TRINITY_DN2001_c0_g1_i2:143-445(-)
MGKIGSFEVVKQRLGLMQSGAKRSPADFLKQILGRLITVKLVSGTLYIGVLVCLDGNMNIVLENIEEHEGGVLKQKIPVAFIRGNNVMYISAKNLRKPNE